MTNRTNRRDAVAADAARASRHADAVDAVAATVAVPVMTDGDAFRVVVSDGTTSVVVTFGRTDDGTPYVSTRHA